MAKADEEKPAKPAGKAKGAKAAQEKPVAVASVESGGKTPVDATTASSGDPVTPQAPSTPDSAPEKAARSPKAKKEEPAPVERPKENLSLDPNDVEKPKIVKAKGSKNIHAGVAHVLSTFNNTIVTITDLNGNVIGWSSAGKVGFKGSRKSTAYAAQMVAQDASRQAMGHGLKEVEVLVKGPGAGRESAVRALQAIGLDLTIIRDVTPVPHNGCRPPKQRRV